MEKEEVLSIELPKGAEYRRVEVTDGVVSIVYVKDSVEEIITSDKIKTKKENRNIETKEQFTNRGRIKRVTHFGLSSMPEIITEDSSKPTPLIGGTEVYQKYNGTNYWYCRIKNGRDEFMYLPFDDLTEHDLLYDSAGKERVFSNNDQEDFKDYVLDALKNKPENGFVWIPVYEPSRASDGSIQYVSGEEILDELYNSDWERIIKQYSPQNGSRMASVRTYYLLLMRWLKDGIATIEQICNYSTEIGNYNNPNEELTGDREFGGLFGFVGNTYKIVKGPISRFDFYLFGGDHYSFGFEDTLNAYCNTDGDDVCRCSVGLLELTR